MCIRQAFQSMHAAVCCLIFMAIVGPILIIVGVVLLVSPNHRADDVDAYNKGVHGWPPIQSQVALWTGKAYQTSQGVNSAVSLSVTTVDVVASGNTDGVTNATSTYLSGSLTSFSTGATGVTYVMNWGTFTRSYTFSMAQTADIQCDSSSCDRNCTASDGRRCTSSLLNSTCRTRYGASSSYSGASVCYGTDVCGTCSYSGFPTRLCAVAEVQSSSTVASADYLSCYYPFAVDSNPYTATSALTVALEVRSSADPFVVMQKLTKGAMDFGLTAGQQASLGLACLGIGIIISVAVFGGVFCVCRSRNQQPQQQQVAVAAQYPVAQQQAGQPVYPQNGQPQYGQPSAYGQPQTHGGNQGYQPPSYGQPSDGSHPASEKQDPHVVESV